MVITTINRDVDMKVLAIDPGNIESAYVLYEDNKPTKYDYVPNEMLAHMLEELEADHMAIEMIASYGMPVGKTVFETCVWIGRFIQIWEELGRTHSKIYRMDVKMHLCHSMRAKDANIRQALLDRFEPTGGGKTPQLGTKSQPGPLYGVSGDMWAALAVAVTYADKESRRC